MAKKKAKKSVGRTIALTFRNIFLTLLLIILFVGIIGAGIVAGALFGYMETVEPIDVSNMKLNLTSFVYGTDADGQTVELERLYDSENRIWVDLSDIPVDLQNAFISIEDERFYSHHGFDVKRTAGAALSYIKNKLTGSTARTFGGSTITQQLIKNLTDEKDYSLDRKIQEIYRAYQLEKELSKEEILEYYLNTIYLSQRCNGVSSAANTYFGKSVSELSLAECASIAGITQSPTKYDPYLNPENNKQKQETVLYKMLEL
ncbi:MAG: transglycosylase domain-containing protein [Clostridia bacterium]